MGWFFRNIVFSQFVIIFYVLIIGQARVPSNATFCLKLSSSCVTFIGLMKYTAACVLLQVPMNQPEASLDMLNHFVRSVPFENGTPISVALSGGSLSSSLPRKMAPVE
jgi:hypothetical protein